MTLTPYVVAADRRRRRILLCVVSAGVLLSSMVRGQAANACDLDASGSVTSADVTLATNMAIGAAPCTANIIGAGVCNVAVVQRVINAIGGACVTGDVRQVVLNWVASTSQGVTGYNVYRGTTAGGPYPTLLTSSPIAATTFTDNSANVNNTFYYIVRAVSSAGESVNSNEAVAIVTVGP